MLWKPRPNFPTANQNKGIYDEDLMRTQNKNKAGASTSKLPEGREKRSNQASIGLKFLWLVEMMGQVLASQSQSEA